ncbi:MAG TPA: serine protease [Fimbriimonadaceae bacterium]|nr:serine protease [Fimbriimonadaceae bacterium]
MQLKIKPSLESMYAFTPPTQGRRYTVHSSFTELVFPSGLTTRSPDVYLDVKAPAVVSVEGMGKFRVGAYKLDMKALEHKPNSFQFRSRLELKGGNFDRVETSFDYRLHAAEYTEDPKLSMVLGPVEFQQTALAEAQWLSVQLQSERRGNIDPRTRERICDSVVVVRCFFSQGGAEVQRHGSGFFICPHGYIATNRHVIRPDIEPGMPELTFLRAEVDVASQGGFQTFLGEVVNLHAQYDLAIIRVLLHGNPFLALSERPPQEGDPVVAVGFPGQAASEKTPSLRWGRVTALTPSQHPVFRNIEHSAGIEPGSSGGPLLRPDGTVVGINKSIRGPLSQSRIAIDQMLLRIFLAESYAEGDGYRVGLAESDRYRIIIARTNIAIMLLVSELRAFQHKASSIDSPGGNEKADEKQLTEHGQRIEHVLGVIGQNLGDIRPPSDFHLLHYRLQSALLRIHQSVVNCLVLISNYWEDSMTGPGKSREQKMTATERWECAVDYSNEIQAGLTEWMFSTNRVIGKFWSTAQEHEAIASCVRVSITIGEWSRGIEQSFVSLVSGVVLRHKGDKLVFLTICSDDLKRLLVCESGTSSDSLAFLAELRSELVPIVDELEVDLDFEPQDAGWAVTFKARDMGR